MVFEMKMKLWFNGYLDINAKSIDRSELNSYWRLRKLSHCLLMIEETLTLLPGDRGNSHPTAW